MGFFKDIFDSISGKANQDLIKQQTEAQLNLAKEQLAQEERIAALKYDPERAKQQAKIAGYIILAIVIIIIGYFLMKYVIKK